MKNRKVYFDILRIVAILCVIYNHTNERGYYLYAFPANIGLRIFYIIVAAFIAIGVPIFFMISGALLLDKEESISTLYKKRVLRIIMVLIIFSLLQFAFRFLNGTATLSIRWLADNMISDNIIASYWFLYSYLGFLIILPLLRKIVKALDNIDFVYLIGLYLVIEGILPVVLYLIGYDSYNSFFDLPFFDRVIIFPLVGYFLDKRLLLEKYNLQTAIKLSLASLGALAIFVAMTLYRDLPYEEFTTYDKGLYTCGLTLIIDITVFYLAKYLWDIRNDYSSNRGTKLIAMMGSGVFGVYLIEGNIRYYTEFIYDEMSGFIGHFPAAIVWVLLTFVIGLLISWLMKCIPGLKKLL